MIATLIFAAAVLGVALVVAQALVGLQCDSARQGSFRKLACAPTQETMPLIVILPPVVVLGVGLGIGRRALYVTGVGLLLIGALVFVFLVLVGSGDLD